MFVDVPRDLEAGYDSRGEGDVDACGLVGHAHAGADGYSGTSGTGAGAAEDLATGFREDGHFEGFGGTVSSAILFGVV